MHHSRHLAYQTDHNRGSFPYATYIPTGGNINKVIKNMLTNHVKNFRPDFDEIVNKV